jgi:ubiquinone/menaquinone biosynthesis C-methylase UbiE
LQAVLSPAYWREEGGVGYYRLMKKDTSWGSESVVGYYQKNVILPHLTLVAPKKGEMIVDLGCGEGYFAKKFAHDGASIIGVDVSKYLIDKAKESKNSNEEYYVGSAENLKHITDHVADKVTIILAIQNMNNVHAVLKECHRVMKPGAKLYMVMNHPAFRVPKASDWGWDDINKVQFRRVDSYLSESKAKIEMHPSASSGQVPDKNDYTVSFHRPLQLYFKLLKNAGFSISNLEEWTSNKKSEAGPRAVAEDVARKEIPLFLFLEAVKV